MVSEAEIRERVAAFLTGELTLDDFEDWLAQNTWNLQPEGNEHSYRMTHAIEHRLFLYSDNQLNEEGLRDELRPFVERYRAQASFAGAEGFPEPDNPSSSSLLHGFKLVFGHM